MQGMARRLLRTTAPASASAVLSPAPAAAERLSDEAGLSRWASAFQQVKVRTAPKRSARSITKLRFQTEDGYPEVYLALESQVHHGVTWVRIRLPMRPNGRTGWVPRESLGPFHKVRTLLRINRTTLTATLYKSGRKIWSSRVGVGKASTPTPAGRFWIRERLRNLAGSGVYGPWAFGTSAYSAKLTDWPGGGVVGIHGTNQPNLIPGRPSHGCVRVPNHKIKQLAKLMPIGTPVRIV
jgi:hypothetical protein